MYIRVMMADGENVTAELKKCNKAHFSQVKLMLVFSYFLNYPVLFLHKCIPFSSLQSWRRT